MTSKLRMTARLSGTDLALRPLLCSKVPVISRFLKYKLCPPPFVSRALPSWQLVDPYRYESSTRVELTSHHEARKSWRCSKLTDVRRPTLFKALILVFNFCHITLVINCMNSIGQYRYTVTGLRCRFLFLLSVSFDCWPKNRVTMNGHESRYAGVSLYLDPRVA